MSVRKEKGYPGFQIGTSFLLVLFVIICLVLLGVLSLSGALRDKGYSDKVAEKTGLYYGAVSAAQHKLGEIDKLLGGLDRTQGDFDTYLRNVSAETAKVEGVSCLMGEGEATLAYEIPITDSQCLQVELEVLDPEKGEGNYKITKWQEASAIEWEEETTLPVLQFGEDEETLPVLQFDE